CQRGEGWALPRFRLDCTFDSLLSGADLVLIVHLTAEEPGVLALESRVGSFVDDPNGDNNTATLTSTIANADVEVGLSASSDVIDANVPLTYTVTIVNHGPSAAHGLIASETFAPGLTYLFGTGGSRTGDVVTTEIATL